MKLRLTTIIGVVLLALTSLALHANEPSEGAFTSSEPGLELGFSPEELDWLKSKPELTYVYDPDWAPFEWKNDIGNHTGIIADILGVVGKKTGIKFIPVDTETWKESVEAVKDGRADMFSAITKSRVREEYLEFTSKDIYKYPAVLVTKFDDRSVYLDIDADVKGKRVGIVKGSGLGSYIKENHPGPEYVEIPATNDGFAYLRSSKIDMFAINTVTAKYYIEKKGFSDLKIALKLDYTYYLKVAVRKGLPSEVVSIVDKALGSIGEDEYNDIFTKWTEVAVRQQVQWKLLAQITASFVFVILLLAWNNRRLNLKVEDRTEELRHTNVELKESLKKTQQANEAKNLFLASVSHEIRTPMNAVLGMTQTLRGTSLSKEQKLYIETLESSGNILLSLIDDLLDFSKIESGTMVLEMEPFDTSVWIRDIQNLTAPSFENNHVLFTVEVSENFPPYLEGDVVRLKQIVTNLLTNAAKWTREGEVKLFVGGEPAGEKGFHLYCTVEDTGAGIPDDKLNHIFEAFSQLDTNRATKKGVGLGLSICRRLADMMGGSLEVASKLGKGSSFTFSVTLSVPDEGVVYEVFEKESSADRKLSILLVDDNPINLLSARALLEQQGHRVVEAENGRDAIGKLESQFFDVVLMDIHMPVMDGVSATREIRRGATKAKEIPIIGVTASVMREEKESYLEAGMNAVVAKPIIIENLLKLIREVL